MRFLLLFLSIVMTLTAFSQSRVRKANDVRGKPTTSQPPGKKDNSSPNSSAQPETQKPFTFTIAPVISNRLGELWNEMSLADHNLNILLKQPNNNELYDFTQKTLLRCKSLMSNLGTVTENDINKASNSMLLLLEKAHEVDRLRQKKSSEAAQKQAEEISQGFMDMLKKNETRNNELNKNINDLEEDKASSEKELQDKQSSVFQKLLDKEKSKQKKPFNPASGDGYTRILFEDSLVKVTYYLTKIEHRDCEYGEVVGSEIIATENGTKVELKKESLMFRGYYYKAVCEIINKRGLKLEIVGGILAGGDLRAKEHILPIGPIAVCMGFDKKDTYWDKYYFEWNFVLTNSSFKSEGTFWTEIPNETPAFGIGYSVLKK